MSTPALTWHLHSFDELSPTRLYALLKIRQEVFAVEQDSVYLDVDGKDSAALHLYALHGDVIQAYCRILAPDAKYAEASIGRVLTNTNNRRNGTGRALMQRAMQCCA